MSEKENIMEDKNKKKPEDIIDAIISLRGFLRIIMWQLMAIEIILAARVFLR